MGQKYLLDGASFTDTKFPIIRDDKGLTPGSLVLIDPTHSFTGLSGVPANNQTVYNVAWNEAKAILGSGDATTLSNTFKNEFTAGQSIFERTPKGGIHGIVRQSSAVDKGAWFQFAQAIKNYINANPSRDYIAFFWYRITRASPDNSNMREFGFANAAGVATNFLFNGGFNNSIVTPADRTLSDRPTGYTGAPNGNDNLNIQEMPVWGNALGYRGMNGNNAKSFVLYRVHIIDVALSGMTSAQLQAADLALFNLTFGAGGRLAGDTVPTSPSTLP